jgi:hypothetical protein
MGSKKTDARVGQSRGGLTVDQSTPLVRLARRLNARDLVAVIPESDRDPDLEAVPGDLQAALCSILVPRCRTLAELGADPHTRLFMEFRLVPTVIMIGWSAGGRAPTQRWIQSGFVLDRAEEDGGRRCILTRCSRGLRGFLDETGHENGMAVWVASLALCIGAPVLLAHACMPDERHLLFVVDHQHALQFPCAAQFSSMANKCCAASLGSGDWSQRDSVDFVEAFAECLQATRTSGQSAERLVTASDPSSGGLWAAHSATCSGLQEATRLHVEDRLNDLLGEVVLAQFSAFLALEAVQRLRECHQQEAEERLSGLRASLSKSSAEERARFENLLAKARDRESAAQQQIRALRQLESPVSGRTSSSVGKDGGACGTGQLGERLDALFR